MRPHRLLACLVPGLVPGLLLALAGCTPITATPRAPWPTQAVGPAPTRNLDAACVADFHDGVDYFPEKTAFEHSSQLSLSYHGHLKRLRFTPAVMTGETLEFWLLQCGAPPPRHLPRGVVLIQVPIQRLATGNSSMLGALDELGLVDRLVGTESARSISVPSIKERVARGLVHDMWGYGHMSIEPVMAAQPDVYLSFYSAYPQANLHPRLWELGVRAVPQADHLEPHPLGRAEWLKLLALLTNTEARANAVFAPVRDAYQRLAARAAAVAARPLVLGGFAAGRDTFEGFGGLNQRARLIADAGGRYSLQGDRHAGSLVYFPFEQVYAASADADVWLGTLGGRASRDHLVADNPLHGWFRPVREGRVHAWDRGYTGAWASPYRDQSMARPHHLLADAIDALHPGLLAGDPLQPAAHGGAFFLRTLP